jgi:2'-5' RNA ligase
MNKTKRAIIIFPQLGSNISLIQNIRNQYDSLAHKIAPHITLVFPFKSNISSDELSQHVRSSLCEFKSFNLTMQKIIQGAENHLFLDLIRGQKEVIEIHDLLYSGLLTRFLSKQHHYQPHLTVGRFKDFNAVKIAINKLEYFDYKFETKVDKITTEIILDDLSSKVDFEIKLP